MTPEERAWAYVNGPDTCNSSVCGFKHGCGCTEALTKVIRDAENDTLERSAQMFPSEGSLKLLADSIRALKHPETA